MDLLSTFAYLMSSDSELQSPHKFIIYFSRHGDLSFNVERQMVHLKWGFLRQFVSDKSSNQHAGQRMLTDAKKA